MAGINVASQYSSDTVNYIAKKTLPLARRQLVVFQFADKETLPKGFGTSWTATRYNRLPLPFAPLSEGVPPVGETMTISQVTAVAQQWGDKVTITDVAEMTIFHPPFKKAIELLGLQVAETLERNTFNALMAGTQVNYVNSRGSRGAIASGDVLDTTTVLRTDGALETLGAPRFMGDEQTDTKIEAGKPSKASSDPRGMPHYVGVCHTLVVGDWSQNATVVLARSYSDLNRLYNYEVGEWGGIRFCKSNMVPTFVGVAAVQGTAGTAGNLATNANYQIILTGSDTQNQYESRIYAVSNAISVIGPTGSISVNIPTTPAGFTWNVYVGTTSSPQNLGVCAQGPTSGPLQGMATQLAAGTTAVITGIGIAQVPPATPQVGITVYPTFVFGRGAYAVVDLDDIKFTYLKDADKSDELNQRRVAGWKLFNGVILTNQQFVARIESSSAMSATFG